MPELPEVETVRSGLDSLITGATILGVDIRRDSCVRLLPGGAAEFSAEVVGTRIDAIVRRGKFMWMVLVEPGADHHVAEDARRADPAISRDDAPGSRDDAPGLSLSAHLGMSGQFRVHEAVGEAAPDPHPHCRARLTLAHPTRGPLTLDFLDQRTFGYLHAEPLVPTHDELPAGQGSDLAWLPQSVAHIGRDVLDPHLAPLAASRALRKGARGIKQVLLDQTVVSGIGNIYADEALWLARVHPQRPAHAVSAAQARALLAATREVMSAALAQGGTSFDALYVNVNGESGYFDRSLEAYGRGGEPCGRCARPLRRAMIGGRATHWCATCQRRWAPKAGDASSRQYH
ncbi:bifunctional DNA-formamidopyrimidine glycosylase/DNA-(apurinic or apyrimidinic site) lyase [Demequina sp. NBRC 110054]|uniref:bifunctional DNA-formamidopyrimidine glycosylase/DNA-(apurinic or apyrimidinic site) lyase n=1 Tax=Demequina sp. NBRC 110054 TaxID=1570343 RepID=UPI000A027C65|nr:bifunctional DNA-formamidopyrimidine glycosylase/DNA-(apurinic or apyrimidinic site) lyase [Demequina sp. NBRC 110054]